jgi:hypothetical protein
MTDTIVAIRTIDVQSGATVRTVEPGSREWKVRTRAWAKADAAEERRSLAFRTARKMVRRSSHARAPGRANRATGSRVAGAGPPADAPPAEPPGPLERIRQPAKRVSDRDCSMIQMGLSIGGGRCLYLRRWTLPTSSGRRFGAASQSQSSRGPRHAAGDPGGIRATCSTGSCGSCAPARRGRTCRAGTRHIRRATTASRSGSGRAFWTESSLLSLKIFMSAARST